uniref:Cytochrome P450 n=1 Tax=Kalanchoe fedtschenkoi TaxID=63787 RepID=A0A7N0UAA9_KALFE
MFIHTRDMKMAMEEILGAANWLYNHVWLSDMAIALLGLFVFSSSISKLRNKHGPMLWPVLGIVPTVLLHIHKVHEWATNSFRGTNGTFRYRGMWLGKAYGMVTVDPVKIQYVLKTNFKNFPKGKYYRERFQDLLGHGIFNVDDEAWKQQRRIATSEMHTSRFMEFSMSCITELVHQKLLKVVDHVVASGESIDLQQVLLRFTFDNICMAAFGVDPGCLDVSLPEVPFATAFEHATELTLFRFLVPPFVWKPMRYFGVGFEKRLKESIRTVHEFAEKTVENRRIEYKKLGDLNDWSDLISRLVQREDGNNPGDEILKSPNFLRDFCTSFILAGRDTSSVGLAWFFWLVSKKPDVELKILDEIKRILSLRSEPSKGEIVFTVEELKQMVYLQAAISEALRLYPPVPIDFKETLEDDIFPDGTVVKKGSRILYCIFSMARMESIWGEDCAEFKPERWIKDGKYFGGENINQQFKYVVFNGGPRLCPGKSFAYMQMKMVVASVLLRYSIKVVEGHEVVPKMTTTLYMRNGLLVKFKPRGGFGRL